MDNIIGHNWFDTPSRENGRWVLRFVITMSGLSEVTYCLTEQEMWQMVDELAGDTDIIDRRRRNMAWWAFDNCQDPKEGDGYEFAESVVKDVLLMLYRDDHFHLTLPHDFGEKMVEITRDRLAEIEQALAKIKETNLI